MVTQHTMAELGITSTQASIVFMLAAGQGVTAADLAREYGIDASAVTRLIDRLEKRGLLSRVRSEEDRRVVRLALTPEGHALAEQNSGNLHARPGQAPDGLHARRSRLPQEHAETRPREFVRSGMRRTRGRHG